MDNKVIETLKLVAKKNNLKIDFNNLSTTLKDTGIDSLALLNLIFNVESELKIQVEDHKLMSVKNLEDLINVLQETYNQSSK